jgi:tRNA pseudouridine32 synthase / 23S rRNA pseudouridine746 synthase
MLVIFFSRLILTDSFEPRIVLDLPISKLHCCRCHSMDESINSPDGLTPHHASPSTAFIPILYEDEYILAVNKPHGIAHHNGGTNWTFANTSSEAYDDEDETFREIGILNRLRQQLQLERTSSGATPSSQEEEPMRLYSVHRLDQVTSGILIFAKQSNVAGILSKAFRQHRIVKYYVAVSNKTPKKKSQGYVIGIQERGRRKSWMLLPPTKSNNATLSASPRQRPAHYAKTRFFTAGLGQFLAWNSSIASSLPNGLMDAFPFPRTLLLLRPFTGQTHQLRVAMKSVGIPILGDPVYNHKSSSVSHMRQPRCYLHATAIHIPAEILQQFYHETAVRNDTSLVCSRRNITIYCPPSFASAWRRDDDAVTSYEPPWQPILHRLMIQHCTIECPELLPMLRNPGA